MSKQWACLGMLAALVGMSAIHGRSHFNTLGELTAAMKLKGDKASYAEATTFAKVMGELYKQTTGVRAVDVPYKTTADFLNDLKSGVVDYAIMDPGAAPARAKAGDVKILAISMGRRIKALPNIPTIREAGANFELALWFGAMVPAGTPDQIVDAINGWFADSVKLQGTQAFLNSIAGEILVTTPAQGQALFEKDQRDWEGLVKAAGIEKQG